MKRLAFGATSVSSLLYMFKHSSYNVNYLSEDVTRRRAMSQREHQNCLDVANLVHRLRSSSSNLTIQTEGDGLCLNIPFLKDSKWEKLHVAQPALWRRKCYNKNTYAYLSHCRHNFSVKEYFDFMADIESRDSWDSSTKSVKIVEATENNNNFTIYHWEVYSPSWPFANRDYVCTRKIKKVFDERNSDKLKFVTMKSDATRHEEFPVQDGVVRVDLYHSYTMLKHVSETECESYVLIVDDQKIDLPASIISYITATAIPTFMKEMDKQCKLYQSNRGEIE